MFKKIAFLILFFAVTSGINQINAARYGVSEKVFDKMISTSSGRSPVIEYVNRQGYFTYVIFKYGLEFVFTCKIKGKKKIFKDKKVGSSFGSPYVEVISSCGMR